jgi:LPS-assembly lipoprotein
LGLGVGATIALAGLTGCGFRPLHAQADDGASVTTDLSSVRIEPLRDRVGQQMHNFLRDRLNPRGQPVSPSYSLRVELTEIVSETGVRRDETATRANLRVNALFSLFDLGGGEALFAGRSSSTTSYDILENPFATTVSEEDARERALREVADDIQTRLSIYFTSS